MTKNHADDRFALFDDEGGGAIVLSDYRRTLRFEGPSETGGDHLADLTSVFEAVEAAAAHGEWIALAADYGLGACLEPALAASTRDRCRLRAWVFGRAEVLDARAIEAFLNERLESLPPHQRVAGVAEAQLALNAENYGQQVEQVKRWIRDGECYQINLTFPIDFRLYGQPLALYARLRARQPVRYGAFMATPEETLLSFSPELFFERKGCRVVTRPMKGTAPRGATPAEDAARRTELLTSEKERAENVMIVDLLRNDLGRLAASGKVSVDALCEAEAYPSLWQLVSTISAEIPNARLFDLFGALFPCGSITGAPKIAAMQKIALLEKEPRAAYTGALGWVAPGGDCRFNVAIRTLEVARNGHARLGVGSGIVIDADPAREYAECLLKASFLTGFDPGFELLETMRLEQGAYGLLGYHLERLAASARALGFVCDLAAINDALIVHATEDADGVRRVRLSLAHDGRWKIASASFPAETSLPRYAVLADEKLDPDDYLLRHKTTARSRYDKALQALDDRPQVFDAIFLNERGEVCEGARSNVFIERDGVLLTPPLSCGLLPGVMRRHLLESGRVVEHVLYTEDLLSASTIYLANALRGLIPVSILT